MSDDFDMAGPDRFSVGTFGPVGDRVFLLHCAEGSRSLTVKVEKQQVAVLASYLGRLVRELGRPGHLPEDLDFDASVDPDWVVGTIGVSYDEDLDRLVVVVEEIGEDDDEDGSVARIAVTREQAAAFAIRATQLVEAGRPPCPLCGLPLDPSGHDCPPDERPPTPRRRDGADVTAAAPSEGADPAAGGPPVVQVLEGGEMTVHGRIAGSSNATLLVTCTLDGAELLAVYKPARGERPLWDFPSGLHRREVAAYVLSEALGWGLVPETVERAEGPFGPGSLQRLVPEDGRSHYFTLRNDDRWWPTLVRLAAYDVVANNADRKSGHVLLAEDRLWAIDHGLTFHEEAKLRTVIWDFAGEPLPEEVRQDLEGLVTGGLPDRLGELLDDQELEALAGRARDLVDAGELPSPDEDREWPPYPWPLV